MGICPCVKDTIFFFLSSFLLSFFLLCPESTGNPDEPKNCEVHCNSQKSILLFQVQTWINCPSILPFQLVPTSCGIPYLQIQRSLPSRGRRPSRARAELLETCSLLPDPGSRFRRGLTYASPHPHAPTLTRSCA